MQIRAVNGGVGRDLLRFDAAFSKPGVTTTYLPAAGNCVACDLREMFSLVKNKSRVSV